MGAHPRGEPVVDRPDVQIDGLQAAEGALDAGEALVGADHVIGGQSFVLDTGADDMKAVEPRLGGDAVGIAGEGEAVCGDGDVEQLGELVAVLDAANGAGDLVLAAGAGAAGDPKSASLASTPPRAVCSRSLALARPLRRPEAGSCTTTEPLTDPDLTLSRHPARATERRLPPPVENWSSSCCQLAHSQRR